MLFGQNWAPLTSFNEDILKVPGAGGRPQAKIIERSLSDNLLLCLLQPPRDPPRGRGAALRPRGAGRCRRGGRGGRGGRDRSRAACAGQTLAARQRKRGHSRQGGLGRWQESEMMNIPVCACNDLKRLPLDVHAN